MSKVNAMNKVIVDKSFLDLDEPISRGLVSGLKNLSQKGLTIELKDCRLQEDDFLSKIFRQEGIQISEGNTQPEGKTFLIVNRKKSTDKKDENKNLEVIRVAIGSELDSFSKAAQKVIASIRSASKQRDTRETKITVKLSLDGSGKSKIRTGVGFFDHMLEQIAKHANLDLEVVVKGDLFVDEHHTVEDTGITLGLALNEALGDKLGIKRYGYFLPMDESVAKCALDLGGRSFLNFKCKFSREKVGDFPTELVSEFFRGLASGLKANIYLRAKGENDHHKIEALFKAFAKALNEACRQDERSENILPTTKGIL